MGGRGLIFCPTLDPQKPVKSRLGAAPPVPSFANLSSMLALPSRRGGGGSVCCLFCATAKDAKIRTPARAVNMVLERFRIFFTSCEMDEILLRRPVALIYAPIIFNDE